MKYVCKSNPEYVSHVRNSYRKICTRVNQQNINYIYVYMYIHTKLIGCVTRKMNKAEKKVNDIRDRNKDIIQN